MTRRWKIFLKAVGIALGIGLLPLFAEITEIHLAYTANLNGNLETCHCGGNNLGGMVQLKATIDSLSRRYPDLILVDSGDFLTTYSMPQANALMWELMSWLPFSAINPGDQEFVEGWLFFRQHLAQNSLPLVSINLKFPEDAERTTIPRYRICQRGASTIYILGVTPASAFDFIQVPEVDMLPVTTALQEYLPQIQTKADLIVLLYHDSYRHAQELLHQFPQIHVMIAGHSQEKGIIQTGNQVVLQPGTDGEYLGLLTIILKDGTIEYQNRFIPVSPQFGEDQGVKKRVETFYQHLEKEDIVH